MVAGKGVISRDSYLNPCGWGPLTAPMSIVIVEDRKEEKA